MLLEPERNCWRIADCHTGGLLIDAHDYYKAFHELARQAERRMLLAGWQFDSRVPLLRGSDREAGWETELLPFLEQLIQRRPELEISILAWDYSIVYALEREWLQRLIFDFSTNPRIRFCFDQKHAAGASHHQKFVVIDGRTAFAGGIDLCDSRWDDRRHLAENGERVTLHGKTQKPYHDVMAYVTGAAATQLEQLFEERWQLATGELLDLRPVASSSNIELSEALPLRCKHVAISRTRGEDKESGLPRVQEILSLYQDAIASAQSLIYIETQYFTARVVQEALIRRMQDQTRPRVQVVLVMPKGADSPKEDLVLGRAQNKLLGELHDAAGARGHQLRVCYTSRCKDEQDISTFIHSKLLIVDDRLLSVGSANLTNRSMHIDSELNLTWECTDGDGELGTDIRRIRASLLAEHSGVADAKRFEDTERLVTVLDELVSSPDRCLRSRPLPTISEEEMAEGVLRKAFDPEEPLDQTPLTELLGLELPRVNR